MTLSAAARLQANSGTVTTAATSFTATLPAPVTDGSTLLLFFAAAGGPTVPLPSVDPPWLADVVQGGSVYMWRRANQPAGETSWTVSAAVSSFTWAWRVEEWAGLSTVGQPDAAAAQFAVINGSQVNDLNSSQSVVPDVSDFAGLAVVRAAGGTAAFPAGRSWSSGWSETDSPQVGTGASNTDFMLLTAEAYPGVSGSLDVILTWDITGGGTYTDKSVAIAAACYQPAAPPPALGVLAAP